MRRRDPNRRKQRKPEKTRTALFENPKETGGFREGVVNGDCGQKWPGGDVLWQVATEEEVRGSKKPPRKPGGGDLQDGVKGVD